MRENKYRVVLLRNKKKKKVLYECMKKEFAFNKFNNIIENNNVIFPQKFINSAKIIPVEYELCIIKRREESDKNRMIRNNLGQIVEEKSNDDKWVILERIPLEIEETFWVYKYNKYKDRFNISRIVSEILVKNLRKRFMIKEVIVLNNKIIIQSDLNDFNIILCKCKSDAYRLNNMLIEAIKKTAIKNILFLGEVTKNQIPTIYHNIMQVTGWNYQQARRVSTRH